MRETEDLSVKPISMVLSLLSVLLVTRPFVVIVLTLLVLNGIQSISLVLIARSLSLEEVSLNMEESPIVKLTIINRLDLNAVVVVNLLLDDVLMLLISDGILNTLFALSVWNRLLVDLSLNKMVKLIARVATASYGITLVQINRILNK